VLCAVERGEWLQANCNGHRGHVFGAKMDHGYVTSGAGWFTLSLVNAGLAQGKNRSGWNWFLVSLLLGPLATFFIVSWSPLERSDR
jgi:hypothetical protein